MPGLLQFPPPWTLLDGLKNGQDEPATRRVAYAGGDAVKNGSDYDDNLPHNSASRLGVYALLSPNWVDGFHSNADDLAYCTYWFHLPGYDGLPRVSALWQDAPSKVNTCWFGLGNWVRDRWEWYPNTSLGYAELPSITPYWTDAGDLLLVVLRIGTDSSQHYMVRLGGLPPVAVLAANPSVGSVPLTTELYAMDSAAMEGSLIRFEWDADGDGVYEADTGDSGRYTVTYSTPGVHRAAVRVTNSCMATNTATYGVSVIGDWQHTWGLSADDTANGLMVGSSCWMWTVGTTDSLTQPGTRDILVCMWSAAGQLIWAKTFDSGGDDCAYDACPSAGGFALAGSTETGGNRDVLVQRWTRDGSLVWSCKFGGAGEDEGLKVTMCGGSVVGVAGDTSSSSATKDVFACCLDENELCENEHRLYWAQTRDLGAGEHATCLAESTTLDGQDSVGIAAETELGGAPSVCVLEYTKSTGELVGSYRLGSSLAGLRCGQVFSAEDEGGVPYYVMSGVIDQGAGYKPFIVHLDQTGSCVWGKVLDIPAPAVIEGMVVDDLIAGGITLTGAIPGGDALERVLLLNFSPLNGDLLRGMSWGGTGAGADCHSVVRMYDTGLVLAGSSVNASGSWEPLTGAVTDLALAFTDIAGTGGAADWQGADAPGTLTDVTAQGVLDTGAGACDSLIMFALAPPP